ncbi:MAG TPA: hypothetical protein VHX65_20615 [Pirellulales bacterium]|nr:hypothetical protein [Pirellulales bacterium]
MSERRDTHRKPAPLLALVVRPHCPICGKTVYSATGSHPQCMYHVESSKKKP